MRRSLDLLINDLNWKSSEDHFRAKFELEVIAMNHIEYSRSEENLFNKLCHFFRANYLGIIGEFDGAFYVEQAFSVISICKLVYVSGNPESVVTYEFTPPED
jgi:hypothetical protein